MVKTLTRSVLVMAITIFAVSCFGRMRYGSWTGTQQVLVGNAFVVAREQIDCGEIPPGSEAVAVFDLRNVHRVPIRIVGLESPCDCTTAGVLPLTISPGGSARLPVVVHVDSEAKAGSREFVVKPLLDVPSPPIPLRVVFRVQSQVNWAFATPKSDEVVHASLVQDAAIDFHRCSGHRGHADVA